MSYETRQALRHRTDAGAPALDNLRQWELCWSNAETALYIRALDTQTGDAVLIDVTRAALSGYVTTASIRTTIPDCEGVSDAPPSAQLMAVTYDGLSGLMDGTYAAAKATQLATARTINGVAFDGTANITLPDSGGSTTDVENLQFDPWKIWDFGGAGDVLTWTATDLGLTFLGQTQADRGALRCTPSGAGFGYLDVAMAPKCPQYQASAVYACVRIASAAALAHWYGHVYPQDTDRVDGAAAVLPAPPADGQWHVVGAEFADADMAGNLKYVHIALTQNGGTDGIDITWIAVGRPQSPAQRAKLVDGLPFTDQHPAAFDATHLVQTGTYVGWNYPSGSACSFYVNSCPYNGGHVFWDRMADGTYTLLATLGRAGAGCDAPSFGTRAGNLRVASLGLPGATSQYVRGDGSLATFPDIPSGDITTVNSGVGLSGGGSSGYVTVSLGDPSSCSPSTSNNAYGSTHTHALTGVAGTPATCSASTGNSNGSTHTHNISGFLPLTGGTLTGTLTGTTIQGSTIRDTSDRRLKRDIEPLRDGMDIVRGLAPVRYTRTATGEREIGLIAQEVLLVAPELVGVDADGTLSLAYQRLVAPLIDAVQAQQRMIDNLCERLAALEA